MGQTLTTFRRPLVLVGACGLLLVVVLVVLNRLFVQTKPTGVIEESAEPTTRISQLAIDPVPLTFSPVDTTDTTSDTPTYALTLGALPNDVALTGIAIDLELATTATVTHFQIADELTQAGWSVAINQLTPDESADSTTLGLALINAQTDGATLTTPTVLGLVQVDSALSPDQVRFNLTNTQIITKTAQTVPLELLVDLETKSVNSNQIYPNNQSNQRERSYLPSDQLYTDQ